MSACAVGPLVDGETGRTVGRHNSEFTGGYGSAGFEFKYTFGLTENFDLGVQVEELSAGIRAKYSFIHPVDRGFGLALAAGAGTSQGGDHYYGDVDTSYLIGHWEPFLAIRVVEVVADAASYGNQNDLISFKTDAYNYAYGQGFLGTRVWLGKRWFLTAEASFPFLIYPAGSFFGTVLYNGSFGCRF